MNYIKRITILVLALSLFCACPDKDIIDSTIYIKNETNKDIYIWVKGEPPILDWKPNDNFLILSGKVWELEGEFKKRNYSNNDKLYIWLFDRKLIDSISWEQVKRDNLYLKRYDLTTQDLERMNWEIVYDGN